MLKTVYLQNYLFNLAYFPEINDDDDGNEDMMIKTLFWRTNSDMSGNLPL